MTIDALQGGEGGTGAGGDVAAAPVADTSAVAAPAVTTSDVTPPAADTAPASTSAPAVTAAPAAEPAVTAAPAPTPAPSLLSEAGKETPAPSIAPDATDAPPVELPKFAAEEFTIPEGVVIANDANFGAFTNALAEFEAQTKLPHELVVEHGQKLMDLYANAAKAQVAQAQQAALDTWNSTRADWVKQIKDDPVIGRNRFETVKTDAVRVRDMFATPRTIEMMDYTGAGDHPGMMELFHNVAKFLHKHGLLREGTPVPAPPSRAAASGKTNSPRSRYTGPSTQKGV